MKKLFLMMLVVCMALLPAAAGAAGFSDQVSYPLDQGLMHSVWLELGSGMYPDLLAYLKDKNPSLPDSPATSAEYDEYYQTWKELPSGKWSSSDAIEITDSNVQLVFGDGWWASLPYASFRWKSGVTLNDASTYTVTYELGEYQFELELTPGQWAHASSVTGAVEVVKQSENMATIYARTGQQVTMTASLQNRLDSNERYQYYWYEYDPETNALTLLNPGQPSSSYSTSLPDDTSEKFLDCYVYQSGFPEPSKDDPVGNNGYMAVFRFDLFALQEAAIGAPAASPDVPATGDGSAPLLWLCGLLASGGAIALLRRRAKRSA